jgi:hypothetical protein
MMGIVIIGVDLYALGFGARRFDCFCVAIPFFHYFECLMIMFSMCHVYYGDYNEHHVSIYANSQLQQATQALLEIIDCHQGASKVYCKD